MAKFGINDLIDIKKKESGSETANVYKEIWLNPRDGEKPAGETAQGGSDTGEEGRWSEDTRKAEGCGGRADE